MALWNPTALSQPVLWLDGKDPSSMVYDGSNVLSEWADKSGNNFIAAQSDSVKRPVYDPIALSGQPGIDFDGSNDFLSIPHHELLTFPANTDFAVLVVLDLHRVNSLDVFYSKGDAQANSLTMYVPEGDYRFRFNGTAADLKMPVTLGQKILAVRRIGGTTRIEQLGGGTAQVASSNTVAATNLKDTVLGAMDNGTSRYFNGVISEVVSFRNGNGTTLDEYDTAMGYLAWRWGLEAGLAVDHPYRDAAPTLPFAGALYGTTLDKDGNPASRRVTVLGPSGACVATQESDPITGAYSIDVLVTQPYTLVFDGEPDRNAQVFANVMPVEPPE